MPSLQPQLQLRSHVETEKLERTTLKQLGHRLRRDFALLLPQIELLDQPTTSKSSSREKRIIILEKRLSIETCRYNSRLNSLQHQLSNVGDEICQFEHSDSRFILWKITSIKLVGVRQIMVSEAWAGKCSNHPTPQPCFSLSPIWL